VTTTREWELIIVDNSSSDGTSEYLASHGSARSEPGHLIATYESKLGLAAARNKGWRTARAPIVAFTDDDCYVQVDSMLRVFADFPTAGFMGGRVLLFDDSDYRITILEIEQPCHFRPSEFIAAGAVQGANMAFRRAVLTRIGGFDERLGAGTEFPSEDIDAAASSLWTGIPGVYDPRPVVYHHHGRKTAIEADKLMRSYDRGRGAYYAKYILRKASRSTYVRAWLASVKNECVTALRSGGVPRRSLRELLSGLRFALSQHGKRKPPVPQHS
jgi:glycosyltransferase involved in cell wall biosynthesis